MPKPLDLDAIDEHAKNSIHGVAKEYRKVVPLLTAEIRRLREGLEYIDNDSCASDIFSWIAGELLKGDDITKIMKG